MSLRKFDELTQLFKNSQEINQTIFEELKNYNSRVELLEDTLADIIQNFSPDGVQNFTNLHKPRCVVICSLVKEINEQGKKDRAYLVKKETTYPQEQYTEGQKNCGLKVGDKVKITRKANSYENGWDNVWLNCMDAWVNKTGTIEDIFYRDGIRVKNMEKTDSCCFPYFVLEKVEQKG